MSRIGNAIITIPSGVSIETGQGSVIIKGPKGELSLELPHGITVVIGESNVAVKRDHDDTESRALHGFVRAKLANDVAGVTQGWSKSLELSGVGYRASLSGANLVLTIGFSHPVNVTPLPGITFAISEGKIMVSGIDKQLVGQVAASIRELKKPEPYKGKGIKYAGEHIRKKAGKAAKAIGGAPGAK